MRASRAYDPSLYEDGTPAASGRCSHHRDGDGCAGEAVVSFQDADGRWQAGCSVALEQLVDAGEIEPFGQGA